MPSGPPAPLLAAAFPDAADLGDLLRRHRLRIAVAESCTGGLLGAVLTAFPGSSDYVLGGVIAYSNALKIALLGVSPALLETYGAVSAECATAMAEGVRERTGADVAASITGVAGPTADESSKPPGLIYVAVAGPGEQEGVIRLDGDHGREGNRAAAVHAALSLVADMVGSEA